jgi:DNA mismatch repair protein MutH
MIRPTVQSVYNKVVDISGIYFYLPKDKNKGKAGNHLESITGIPTSSDCLDCSDGEAKTFPVKLLKNGMYVPKETIAVTMLTKSLAYETFENSKCFKKLSKVLYVPYLRERDKIMYLKPTVIDLTQDKDLCEQLKKDYELIQQHFIKTGTLEHTSKLGKYLQNRTKGPGGNAPKTRSFYLRTTFIKTFIPYNVPMSSKFKKFIERCFVNCKA